jgi:hypothetical protein
MEKAIFVGRTKIGLRGVSHHPNGHALFDMASF